MACSELILCIICVGPNTITVDVFSTIVGVYKLATTGIISVCLMTAGCCQYTAE